MNSKKCGILHSKHSTIIGCSLIFFAISFLAGCWSSKETSLEPKLVVINVLDPAYHEDCRIKGSINIPFEQLEERMKTLNKNDEYVLYCSNHACTAAPFSCQMMKDAGFSNVHLFPGGIVQWYQKGLPCEGPAQLQYLQENNREIDFDGHAGIDILSPEQLLEKLQQAKLV